MIATQIGMKITPPFFNLIAFPQSDDDDGVIENQQDATFAMTTF